MAQRVGQGAPATACVSQYLWYLRNTLVGAPIEGFDDARSRPARGYSEVMRGYLSPTGRVCRDTEKKRVWAWHQEALNLSSLVWAQAQSRADAR